MRLLKLTILFVFSITINAQTIEKFSIDSGGNNITASNLSVLYTIGEVNINEVSNAVIISEGFINPLGSGSLSILNIDNEYITVYPNPTSGFINIKSNIEVDKTEIIDILGKVISNYDNPKRIDIGMLQNGVYLFKLHINNKIYDYRIIKN